MTDITLNLEEGLESVVLTVAGETPVQLKLDVAAVDGLIQQLGALRSALKPMVPMEIGFEETVGAIPSPRWGVEPEAVSGDILFHVRDPRFGWLHYILPRDDSGKLGQILFARANAPVNSAGDPTRPN